MTTKIETCPNPKVIIIHTDFDITINPALKFIIEGVAGVEQINTWGCHKYNFIVEIGEMFDREKTAKIIVEKINEFKNDPNQ